MDFAVVVTSWIPLLIPDTASGSALRSFRLLRPLRSISRFPGLKRLVQTILLSIPQMGNIGLMVLIFFLMFGIVAVQLWKGAMRNRCYAEVTAQSAAMCINGSCAFDPSGRYYFDLLDEDSEGLGTASFCDCGPIPENHQTIELDVFCSSETLQKLSGCDWPREKCVHHSANPYWGLAGWDNIALSMAIIYQILTVTAWQEYMYHTQASAGFINWIYFVGCTLIGGYFLLNLFVAVLNEKFEEAHGSDSSDDDDDDDASELEDSQVLLHVVILNRLRCTIPLNLYSKSQPETLFGLKQKLWKHEPFRTGYLEISNEEGWSSDAILSKSMTTQMFCARGRILHNETLLLQVGVTSGDTIYIETSATRKYFKTIVQSFYFNSFFMLCILLNTAVLAMDHHGMSSTLANALDWTNWVLTLLFTIEIVLKLIAFIPDEFLGDGFNTFDFVIVALGIPDLASEILGSKGGDSGFQAFRIFRLFRVLRVLRLISFLEPLQKIGRVIMMTVRSLGYISCLLVLFTYIFSILGMQLFGGKFNFDGGTPRANFDSFIDACVTTVQVLTFDAWNFVLFDGVRASGWAGATWFVLWILIGSFVLLNLLLVIILDSYVEVAEEMHEEEEREKKLLEARTESAASIRNDAVDDMDLDADPTDVFANPLASAHSNKRTQGAELRRTTESIDVDGLSHSNGDFHETPYRQWTQEEIAAIPNTSLGLFSMSNPVRKWCLAVALSKKADAVVLGIIILNCITMMYETPFLSKDELTYEILYAADVVFTIFFTLEFLLKIIALGFACNGERSYLADSWNRLDFGIVLVSVIDLCLLVVAPSAVDDVAILKAFRLLRAFRPLRMLTKLKGLQLLVNSLLHSVSALGSVLAVTMLMWLVFAILGVSIFKGSFDYCTDVNVFGRKDCVGSALDERGDITQLQWMKPGANFDSVPLSFYTLFELNTMDGWIDVAYMGIDAVGVDMQPISAFNKTIVVYFISFIMVSNFFFINLFIGVIYEEYVALKNAGLQGLSAAQKAWYNIQVAISNASPRVRMVAHKSGGAKRLATYEFVMKKEFDNFIIGTIVANCIVMACTFYGEPLWYSIVCNILNYIFTAIFTLEMCLKLFAFNSSHCEPLGIDCPARRSQRAYKIS
eukprot:SAG31_NODE_1869_length_7028_cov_2.847164_4_plen_1132_part_00